MKTRTIIGIILATAAVVFATIVLVNKLSKKKGICDCGCEDGAECDCDATVLCGEDATCCCEDAFLEADEACACAEQAADKVEPAVSEAAESEEA